MKILLPIIPIILIACNLHAASATKNLDPALQNIFERMLIDAEASKLEGKEFETNLTVKVATEKFLIFSDAYLQADEETKYQIGKWMFTPDQVAELKAKRGDVLTVKFRIEAIRTQTPYDDMPHFAATIILIAPFKKAGSQEGGILSESPHSSPYDPFIFCSQNGEKSS